MTTNYHLTDCYFPTYRHSYPQMSLLCSHCIFHSHSSCTPLGMSFPLLHCQASSPSCLSSWRFWSFCFPSCPICTLCSTETDWGSWSCSMSSICLPRDPVNRFSLTCCRFAVRIFVWSPRQRLMMVFHLCRACDFFMDGSSYLMSSTSSSPHSATPP